MQMNKSTLFVLVLSLLMGTPALAQTHAPTLSNVLSAQELEMAFENDGEPMQLALLSEQEMRETKGAILPAVARYVFGGVAGAAVYVMENLGTGRFYADEFGAYMVIGALTAGGHGVGYTEGGRIILTGMAATMVTRFHRQANDQSAP